MSAQNKLDIGDIDELLNSNFEEHVQDVDVNDPELLKQLEALSSASPKKTLASQKPAAKTKPVQQKLHDFDIDIDSYAALAHEDMDEDGQEVELNEEDLKDPALLNELSLLSKSGPPSKEEKELMNMGFTQKQASKALDMFDNNLERAANYLFDTPAAAEAHDQNDDDGGNDTDVHMHEQDYSAPIKDEFARPTIMSDIVVTDETEAPNGTDEREDLTDPAFWKAKALKYQKMALQAKKAGDKKRAVTLLRQSKGYDQKYRELSELHQPKTAAVENPSIVDTETAQPSPQQTSQQQTSLLQETKQPSSLSSSPAIPESLSNSPAPVQQPINSSMSTQKQQELLQKIIPLQKQYKSAAIHYKELGNFTVAKQMVRISKELLNTGIKVKNGEIDDLESVKLPGPPDMTLTDGKLRPLEPANDRPTSFEQVEAQLQYQMDICHNLSVQTAASSTSRNNKASKTLPHSNQQDMYAKAKDAFAADLVLLNADKPTIPSSLHYEPVAYTYKNINDTIPDNMMELKIIRAISLPTLNIATNLDPFVTWDFGGWPPENTAQAAMNKGETPVINGTTDPQFNFTMQIPISRTNRLFQRYVQRRKLALEVFHNKYSYGLFRRPVPLGKVMIPMEQLLTKTAISGIFELLDGRKKTGGKIEIQVNLRQPLMGEDIVKRSEKWLVLDYPGSTASQCLSQAGLSIGGPYLPPPLSTNNSSRSLASVADEPEQTSQGVDTVASTDQQQPPQQLLSAQPQEQTAHTDSNAELEAAEEELNNVDNIISNMVLEHEINVATAALANKSTSSKEKEDLQDRKQALEIKLNMLVIQVQTGLLDMDTYLNNLQKRIDADRRLALVFKKHGKLDLAKAALLRKKIMQDELDEAKAAMAANAEEEE